MNINSIKLLTLLIFLLITYHLSLITPVLATHDYPGQLDQPKETTVDQVFGKVNPPDFIRNLGKGSVGIGNVLSNIITLIYIISGIVFLFMVVIGAFQWIISGGDKDKVAGARARITQAVIGIVLLALAFLIIGVIGQITGFKFFVGQGSSQSTSDRFTPPSTEEHPSLLAPGQPCMAGSRKLGDCRVDQGYECLKNNQVQGEVYTCQGPSREFICQNQGRIYNPQTGKCDQ